MYRQCLQQGFDPAASRGLVKTQFGHVHYKVTGSDELPARDPSVLITMVTYSVCIADSGVHAHEPTQHG